PRRGDAPLHPGDLDARPARDRCRHHVRLRRADTLINTRGYQEESLERTRLWAIRCIEEHFRLTEARSHRPYPALFGVLQGAQYEDLRRKAARDLGGMDFDGFGIGGALEKENLGTIIRWVCEELPEDKPRHLLGISEPDDLFE